ncbi:BBS1 protein [Pelomyxa schiedti]|nr:BBS1 protein [Pelomyxa schiedti]
MSSRGSLRSPSSAANIDPPPTPATSGIMGLSTDSNPKKPVVWLDAYDNPVASIRAYSCHVAMASVDDNADNNLLIADMSQKLKVFANTALVREIPLLEVPVALCTYYMDDDSIPGRRPPAVAVACEDSVYIYKSLRPFSKFTLPPFPPYPAECTYWEQASTGQIDPGKLSEKLVELKAKGVHLSSKSLNLLRIDDALQMFQYVEAHKGPLPHTQTSITCLAVINKCKEEERSVGCLVIGTESSQVLVLEPSATSIRGRFQLKAPPVVMNCTGTLDVDYKIVVACRNQCVYIICNGELTGTPLDLDAQAVGVVIGSKYIFVGCMNDVVYAFQLRGRKSLALVMPCAISCLEILHHQITSSKALLVALSNGEVRVYSDVSKTLLSTIQMPSAVTAMRYGQYGRENGTLVLITESGALYVKILSRVSSNLSSSAGIPALSPELEVPLPIPKKHSLYMDQVHREVEQSPSMHRTFQREVFKLRLQTTRAFVQAFTEQRGQISFTTPKIASPPSTASSSSSPPSNATASASVSTIATAASTPVASLTSGAALWLAAQVQGLGPVFHLKLTVENAGSQAAHNVPVAISHDLHAYSIPRTFFEIPVLLPGTSQRLECKVQCLDQRRAATSPITVYVCGSQASTVPVVSAVVEMPAAALLLLG